MLYFYDNIDIILSVCYDSKINISISMPSLFSSSFLLLGYSTPKLHSIWWLLQFIKQNIEILNKKILSGLKEAPIYIKLEFLSSELQQWIYIYNLREC